MTIPKVLSYIETAIPHGTEYRAEMEMPDAQGNPIHVKQFMRKIDMGDAYTVLMHMTRGTEPAHVMLTTGIKGNIDGEYRIDQVELVMLGSDGSVTKMEPKETKVLLNNPYAGLSFDETFLKLARDLPATCSL